VLVTKPYNKTPYELLHVRIPSIGFMRPFGCPVTILNTLDHLGKFQGKVDEGFLVGYSVCSKAFMVFNSRTRIVQETLYVNFLENKPNVAGTGPTWLFDIDSLTRTMNYHPVSVENQTNSSAGFQDTFNNDNDALVDRKEHDVHIQKFVSADIHSSSSSAQTRKQADKTERENKGKSPVESFTGYRDLNAEFEECSNNSSNGVNAASSTVPTVGHNFINSTNTFSVVGPSNTAVSPTYEKTSLTAASTSSHDPAMPELEELTYSDDEDVVGAEADKNNLESSIRTRSMARAVKDHGGLLQMFNKDFYTFMFACFLLQEEPKRVHQALKDPSWIKAMQEELLQFKMQKVWILVDLPYGKRAIGLQVKQKKDGIFISQDKYVAEILRKFRLTEGKSASTPIDTEKPLMKDLDEEDVYVHTYRSIIGSLMYLTSSRPDIMFAVCACVRFQVTPKASHLYAVKRIFRYLKCKPHLGLWYLKDSPFDLVAYSDSDNAGASMDRKSTTGGCQFLRCRLIFWQCKKQAVVATLSTEAEYIAVASGCAQVL
nr:hypothetical protein [Tanacetum cinerariifolium]